MSYVLEPIMKTRFLATVAVFLAVNTVGSGAKAEGTETSVEAVAAFLRAVSSGDHEAAANSTNLPFHYRQSDEGGPRPYRRCARQIQAAEPLKDWIACVGRWNPSLYDWLRLSLATPPAVFSFTLEAGTSKALKSLLVLAKGMPLGGKEGEWVTGIPAPNLVEYHMLFFVTRTDGHPRVAAFLMKQGDSEAKSRPQSKSKTTSRAEPKLKPSQPSKEP